MSVRLLQPLHRTIVERLSELRPLRFASNQTKPPSPDDISEVQRELDSFFGTEFAPNVGDSGVPQQMRGLDQSSSEASTSAPSRPAVHGGPVSPTAGSEDDGSATLTHVDRQGRASMVDVAEVRSGRLS